MFYVGLRYFGVILIITGIHEYKTYSPGGLTRVKGNRAGSSPACPTINNLTERETKMQTQPRKRKTNQRRRRAALGVAQKCVNSCPCVCHKKPYHIHDHQGAPCPGKGIYED